MKKVSAIITTHNRVDLLKRAIESVLNQTYKNMECIVVDDNSTDNTRELCSQYPVQYIFIPPEESHGGNYARNLGIKASTGTYCAFLDDDDYWLPTKIEKQVKLIENKSCELVYCGVRIEFVKRNGVKFKVILPDPNVSGIVKRKILYHIITTTSCILVNREALIDIGYFDENLRFWQEYDLCIRLAQRTPFFYVNEPLMVYHKDQCDKNRLTNKYVEWRETVNYIRQKYASLYNQLSISEKYKIRLMIWFDAAQRTKSSGMLLWSLYYTILTLPSRGYRNVKYFLNSIFNIFC